MLSYSIYATYVYTTHIPWVSRVLQLVLHISNISTEHTRAHIHTHTHLVTQYPVELYKVNFHIHHIWLAASKIVIFPFFLNHVLEKVGGYQVEFHIKNTNFNK